MHGCMVGMLFASSYTQYFAALIMFRVRVRVLPYILMNRFNMTGQIRNLIILLSPISNAVMA